MSHEVPPLSTKITGDLGPLHATFLQGVSEAREFGRQMNESMKIPTQSAVDFRIGEMMDSLKQAKAEAKKIDEATQALAAESSLASMLGAAGIGYTAAATLDHLTKGAEKFAIAMEKGEDATRDAFAELLKGIPIVGQLGQAGERIFNLASGEAAYVREINEAIAAQERLIKTIDAVHVANERMVERSSDSMQQLRDDIQRMSLPAGAPQGLFDIGQAFGANVDNFAKQRADYLGDSDVFKTLDADLIAARKKVRDLQDRQSNVPATIVTGSGEMGSTVMPNDEFQKLESKIKSAKDHVGVLERLAERKKAADAMFNEGLSLSADHAWAKVKDMFHFEGEVEQTQEVEQVDHLADAIEKVKRQVEQFQMTKGERLFDDFTRAGGAGEALETMKELTAQMDALDEAAAAERERQSMEDKWQRGLRESLEPGELQERGPRPLPPGVMSMADINRLQFQHASMAAREDPEVKKQTQIMDDVRDVNREMLREMQSWQPRGIT